MCSVAATTAFNEETEQQNIGVFFLLADTALSLAFEL